MARFTGLQSKRHGPAKGEDPIIIAGITILIIVVLTCAGLLAVPLWAAFAIN